MRRAEHDYRGIHEAPGRDYGAPMHDLSTMYPDDIYGPDGMRLYGAHHDRCDSISWRIIVAARGKPDYRVKIYRAVPIGTGPRINRGDWVTPCRAYAEDHGEAWLRDGYEIISATARAADLFTEANSLHEWGYDPVPARVATAETRIDEELPEYVYHVTLQHSLDSIAAQGLRPGCGNSNFGLGYSGHCAHRLFLSDGFAAREWHEKFSLVAESGYDDPVRSEAMPVVLRVWSEELPEEVYIDELGQGDVAGESYFITESIHPDAIEVYDGSGWIPIEDADSSSLVDTALAAAEIEYEDDEMIVWPDMDVFLPPRLE